MCCYLTGTILLFVVAIACLLRPVIFYSIQNLSGFTKVEFFSWYSWLTYSGRFTHISGYPFAVGRAQDRESSPVKDRRSTTVTRNQPRMHR